MSGLNPIPSNSELEILHVLWRKGPQTVRQIHPALRRKREIGYTTVLKTLQIMTEKGLVAREEAGKAHIYSPAMREADMQTQLLKDLSEKLFSGSPALLAMHALSLQPASEDELEQIRALIAAKSK